MTHPDYASLLDDLFPRLAGGIRWGVERTARILATAGAPHTRYATLHVGGTNGKGSVAATLAAVLSVAGRRTGLYTSPHLCTFRERIQVDGEAVGEDEVVRVARQLWPAIEAERASFFEATTAIALTLLAQREVDTAVVEVGLGGRLDATNVISPRVVVLTNVALDHADYLGDTVEQIAAEKAGIIKADTPVVTAAAEPARGVIAARAALVGAPLHVLEPHALRDVRVEATGTRFELSTDSWGALSLHTPLVGAHQAANTALAVRALELLPDRARPAREAVIEGVARVQLAGRLQITRSSGRTWVFDVAHNPAGIAALASALHALPLERPVVVLVGILGDKDWRAMLPPLGALADALVLTDPPTAPPERRWDAPAAAHAAGLDHAVFEPDFTRALERAHAAAGPRGTVVVTGSFHTVGDALNSLGRAPLGADAALPPPRLAV